MLPRALAKDKNDISSVEIPHGFSAQPSPLISQTPFFFSPDGATLGLLATYRGASAFLIGGGPSFREIDPGLLSDVWTISVNNAASGFRTNANCTVDDPSRFNLSMWLDPTIQKFVPMANLRKPLWDNRLLKLEGEWQQQWMPSPKMAGDCPNVVGYRRNEKFHAPRWLHEDTINWGNHKKWGGGRSVLLATIRILYLLGFRKVYLLGVDFDMSATAKYHFSEERTAHSIQSNMSTYAKLQHWFGELQPYFLKEKFLILNCNPNSKLTVFPHLPFQEALDETRKDFGDIRRQKTSGMYVAWEDKVKQSASSEEPPPPSS